MSIFAPVAEEVFGSDLDLDTEISGLESEVNALSDDGASSYGQDEEFGEDIFSQYGAAGESLAMDRGEDAPERIVVSNEIVVGVGQAFNPSFLQGMPEFVKWFQSIVPGFILDQSFISTKGAPEARDMARIFTTQVFTVGNGDRLDASNWGQMSPDEKVDFVNQVVGSAVFGNHADSFDQVSAGWERFMAANGWKEKLKAAGAGWWETTKAFWTQDVWPALKGFLPWTDEQNFNLTAFIYFSGHKVWGMANWASTGVGSSIQRMDPYPTIISQIDAVYAAAGGFTPTADAVRTRAPVIDVPTPPAGGYAEESIPSGDSGFLPRPETILAVGYLVATVPTLIRAL